jgi:hypothetical protein
LHSISFLQNHVFCFLCQYCHGRWFSAREGHSCGVRSSRMWGCFMEWVVLMFQTDMMPFKYL